MPLRDEDGDYTGSVSGSSTASASRPGLYVAGATAPSMMMSYAEQKFIEAEANLMLGQTGPAQTAYEAAVAASVLAVTGVANTTWLEDNINAVPVSLELIMTQKYLATFGTSQTYADYRRTGFPVLPLPVGAILPAMPVRYPVRPGGDNIQWGKRAFRHPQYQTVVGQISRLTNS